MGFKKKLEEARKREDKKITFDKLNPIQYVRLARGAKQDSRLEIHSYGYLTIELQLSENRLTTKLYLDNLILKYNKGEDVNEIYNGLVKLLHDSKAKFVKEPNSKGNNLLN